MAFIIRSSVRYILAGLTLLVCSSSSDFHVFAQNTELLSRRPRVIRTYDPDTNTFTVSAFLLDSQSDEFRAVIGADPFRPPPTMWLHGVEYTYPENVESRPQTVAFVIVPLDKSKSAPNFSVAVDGAVLHQGEATFRETCCRKVNGRDQSSQQIVVAVPMETFERMTQSKKIELKLSSKADKRSFKLNEYQRKGLAALADTIK